MASTYGFIGLGLIGGSIAKGLKAAEPDCVIMAYMRSRARLETARSEGTVDRILTGITEELSACDIIFLCTPTELCSEYLAALKPILKPGAISIISSILAAGGISIKNIGINHNRESGEGALRIEFYDADSCATAMRLVKQYNYRVESR